MIEKGISEMNGSNKQCFAKDMIDKDQKRVNSTEADIPPEIIDNKSEKGNNVKSAENHRPSCGDSCSVPSTDKTEERDNNGCLNKCRQKSGTEERRKKLVRTLYLASSATALVIISFSVFMFFVVMFIGVFVVV
jgi:hypothetical protein